MSLIIRVLFVYALLLINWNASGQSYISKEFKWFPNKTVSKLEVDSLNQILYVGGDFSTVGPIEQYGVEIDTFGSPDTVMVHPNARVLSSIPDGVGGWFIGGRFTRVGDSIRRYLAHIDSSGMVSSWNPDPNSFVFSLVRSGSLIYVGGSFDSIGGDTRHGVASLDFQTGFLTNWNPNVSGTVKSILIDDSTVFLGGRFSSIDGQPRDNIASVHINTGAVSSWDPKIERNWGNWNGEVNCLQLYKGNIIAAGEFNMVGGVVRSNLAEIDRISGMATSWNPAVDSAIYNTELIDSTLFIVGDFNLIGGQTRKMLAKFNLDSHSLQAFAVSGIRGVLSDIEAIGDMLFVAGDFSKFMGQPRRNIASIDIGSMSLTQFNPLVGGAIYSMGSDDSNLYLGGSFTTIGGVERDRLVAYDLTTLHPTSWNPGANGWIMGIRKAGKTVFVVGHFDTLGGQNRNYVGGVHYKSAAVNTFITPILKNEATIIDFEISGSTLYACGVIGSVGGISRSNAASFDTATGDLLPWHPTVSNTGSGQDAVHAIEVVNNIAYLGGQFKFAGSLPAQYLAAFDATTASQVLWPNIPTSQGGAVIDIGVNGNSLYAAGIFDNVGGQPREGLAAVDITTGLATSFLPDISNSNNLSYLYSSDIVGGRIVVIGWLDAVSGKPRNMIADIYLDNSSVGKFDPEIAINPSTILAKGNDLFLGGVFNEYDDFERVNLAWFTDTCPPSFSKDIQESCNSIEWINGQVYDSSIDTAFAILSSSTGCDSVVTLKLKVTNVDTGVSVSQGTLVSQDSGGTYQWLDCNNGMVTIPGATDQSFSPLGSGSFAVEITRNGCIDTSACYLVLGIEESIIDPIVSIFPNPTETGSITISRQGNGPKVWIELYDPLGKLVRKEEMGDEDQYILRLGKEPGVYLIRLIDSEGNAEGCKVIKR